MRVLRTIMLLALAASTPASAQEDAAAHWRALTVLDVEAAHRMLAEDHPGAAEEVGDAAFRRQLTAGYEKAKSRAARVASYEGYLATLAGLSVGLGDKHIWSRPLYTRDAYDWTGIIVARRGRGFVVADEEAAEGPPLKGATLISCDGVPADRMADERLGEYKVVRGIEAQLIQRAYWMLLDDGNPFLKRPQACDFLQDGTRRTVNLKWRPIQRTDLSARLAPLGVRGAAGFGLRKAGHGWWIGVQSFSDKAVPVIEEVRAQAQTLRNAPYVVLDLRGNGGGYSQYGRDIARALLGPAYVQARLGGEAGETGCPKVWRLSERNFKQLEYYKTRLGPQHGKEAVEAFTREYDQVASAKTAGSRFSGKASCPEATRAPAKRIANAKPEFAGRVILLTDNVCFSSCLMVTGDFRKLGALHVGEATDANTNYMEVREEKLPSGLSMFSTLQAVAPGLPPQMGPYAPSAVFEGSIADTAALETWIAGLAAAPHSSRTVSSQ